MSCRCDAFSSRRHVSCDQKLRLILLVIILTPIFELLPQISIGVKVVDYIPQPVPHDLESDSDSNVDSDVGSCSKPGMTAETDAARKERKHKLKLPLKINTESFYGDSTPHCAPQTSPMPPSPKVPLSSLLAPSPASLSGKPDSVGKNSVSLPPVSTESASPSAVSNIWRAAKGTMVTGNSSNTAVESGRKSTTDRGVKSALNGESNGTVGDSNSKDGSGSNGKDGSGSNGKDGSGSNGKDGSGSNSKDGSGSNGKGYRHRPDPLWRSVHSDGNELSPSLFLPPRHP
jgi:hypothetical protein